MRFTDGISQTEEHLHHMARRHHATMKKLEAVHERSLGIKRHLAGTLGVGAGAWLGGLLGGTGHNSVGPLPINLGVGALLLVAGNSAYVQRFVGGDKWSDHFNNLGSGFIGAFFAEKGFSFGQHLASKP